MTCKTGFEFSILVSLGFQAKTWRPRERDALDPITQVLCMVCLLFSYPYLLSPSFPERGLVHICGHCRLHMQALFIPTLKAVALPPLRPRAVHTSGTIFSKGIDEKRHEQVLEASSGLFRTGNAGLVLTEWGGVWASFGFGALAPQTLPPRELFTVGFWERPL